MKNISRRKFMNQTAGLTAALAAGAAFPRWTSADPLGLAIGIQLYTVGAEVAGQFANASTAALGAARNLLLGTFESELEAQLERETRSIAALGGSEETRTRVTAFLERRSAKPGKDH